MICTFILKKNKISKSGFRTRNQRFDNSNRAIHSALTTELTRQLSSAQTALYLSDT